MSQLQASSGTSMSSAARMAALRAEVELELQNKKQCAYKPYECTKLAIDNYIYCNRHILEDKIAPFKQCNYISITSGKRCYMPAPKGEKKDSSYCNEHALKSHMMRTKQSSRYPAPPTPEVLLHSLSHYVKKSRTRTTSNSTQSSDECGRATPEDLDTKVTKHFDPFSEINVQQVNQSCSEVLDMCSESESDVEPSTYSTVWQDAQADTSDNESVDSEQEDLLKHANVYTAEEITQVTREKLIRLQALYIDQYKYLQHLLREKRRKYLHNIRREKETYCNIQNQVKDNPKELRLYKKLKSYNRYHKKNGVEAVLSKRVNDLRVKITDGLTPKPVSYIKCNYTEGGVKCGERALPSAKFCRKHILEDPFQVLFKACGKSKADIECKTPIEGIFDDTTCPLHMAIPSIRSYSHIRKDSESDYDDETENRSKIIAAINCTKNEREIDVKKCIMSDVELNVNDGKNDDHQLNSISSTYNKDIKEEGARCSIGKRA